MKQLGIGDFSTVNNSSISPIYPNGRQHLRKLHDSRKLHDTFTLYLLMTFMDASQNKGGGRRNQKTWKPDYLFILVYKIQFGFQH